MIRARRSEKIELHWTNIDNESTGEDRIVWNPEQMKFDLAELLQHEVDHLEGADLVRDYDEVDKGLSAATSFL